MTEDDEKAAAKAKVKPGTAAHRVYTGHVAMTPYLWVNEEELDRIALAGEIELSVPLRARLTKAMREYAATIELQRTAPSPHAVTDAKRGRKASVAARKVAANLSADGIPIPPVALGRPPNDWQIVLLSQIVEIFELAGGVASLPRADFHEEEGGFYHPKDGLGRTAFARFLEAVAETLPEDTVPTGDGFLWAMYRYLKKLSF